MLDNAPPGKMGWGEDTDTDESRLVREQRAFEALSNAYPDRINTATEPDYNENHFNIVKKLMQEDGIDNGFSANHVEKAVFDNYLLWLEQLIGSCVGSGGGRVVTQRTLIEVFLLNEPEEILGTKLIGTNNVCPFIPFSYRAGRKIGGINRGDGSFCGAHIEGLMKYGSLPCSTPGIVSDAFPEPQNTSTYRNMGNSDELLTKFGPEAKVFLMEDTIKITDGDQGKDALTKFFQPAMICSNWAFEPDYKHASWKFADGTPVYIYKRNTRTSWAHNMSIVAVVEAYGKWWVFVKNSWGMKAHKSGDFFVIPFDLYGSWCRVAEQSSIGNLRLRPSGLLV